MMDSLELRSGCRVTAPLDRLLTFCREEYDFYDAVPSTDPDHVDVVDVAVTTAVNSFINTAAKLRTVQRGLADRCDPILRNLPAGADLAADDAPVERLEQLLNAAVQVPGVLIPVATKVLHRKRPRLIPMLDQVVLDYYLDALDKRAMKSRTQDSRHAASVARSVIDALRADLRASTPELDELGRALGEAGYTLAPVRVLDILVWTQIEPRGYYR